MENAPDSAGAAQTVSTTEAATEATQLPRRATKYRAAPKQIKAPVAVPKSYESPAQILVYEKEKNRQAGKVRYTI